MLGDQHIKKTLCSKCDSLISNANFKKHSNSCDGIGLRKPPTHCKWCNLGFSKDTDNANHTRWCELNPKRNDYNRNLEFQRSKLTDKSREKQAAGVKKAHADGKYLESNKKKIGKPGTKHTDETKDHLREKALASSHRRLVRSIRSYIKKDGSVVKLDSSWEEALAKRLDEIDVEWVRPSPIKWLDADGIHHNYFPDFYLPEYDVFLDPKNPQAYRVQANKIDQLTAQIKNLTIITTLEECKNFTP